MTATTEGTHSTYSVGRTGSTDLARTRPPRPEHYDDRHGGIRLAHLRVGLPGSEPDGAGAAASELDGLELNGPEPDRAEPDRGEPSRWEWRLSELLAPFVAWLATQDIDEPGRRRHRDAAERFLRWTHTDTGPDQNRRRRYEHHLHGHDPEHLPDARAGLDWWTDHRCILALTEPACP
ncbi:hypothetical protein [Pseudonocardia endophytica]|uniref:Uncharacterized protein n=1 Tax=Pseudonocardia endophytica TaxID=401976 RepID=A0A4R1HTI4_PSEEN|nr:hypothetical protein [Pseudonocardia endophytica]TCK24633.1 hypothetical protein EV378_0409 [Pseudonocardia endophytica]